MSVQGVSAILSSALVASTLCACSSIGPRTVQHDRLDYGTAIADSWKQQTLLNIVKLRYGDFPVFLEIAQVIAGYQMESTVGAGFVGANSSGGTVGPFAYGGSALAQNKYTDRPTVIYAPLTGNDFLKKLMTPIPPSAVLFMLQSGYSASLVMPIVLNSINGVSNPTKRSVHRDADPRFDRVVQLLREMQLADGVQVRLEQPKPGESEITMIVFPHRGDARLSALSTELRKILHLGVGLEELRVSYGGDSGRSDEISMMTRSMLQVMLELGTLVRIPAVDVESGKAAPGAVGGTASDNATPALLDIWCGDEPPKDAYAAVRYGSRWFWIANTDIHSKYTFGLVMLLFSISDTGVRGNAPVVTVPAN